MTDTQSSESKLADEVGTLYTDYPYPAHGIISSVIPLMLRAPLAELERELGEPGRRLRLLDAGCGTGEQTLGIARRYPQLEVVGVDWSEASLAFARGLARDHGLDVHFERVDLSKPLSSSLGTFDVITSIGVLHSLPDTPAGFRHVRAVAKEHAVFMGMVYGSFGREHYYRVREALNELAGDVEGERDAKLRMLKENRLAGNAGPLHYLEVLKNRLRFGPDIQPLEAVRRVLGGRSAQYQADGYTHVKDTAYTWKELAELLDATGWNFAGWPKRSGMPDDPKQLLRGEALERAGRLDLLALASVYERILTPGNLYFVARPSTRP